jgi:sialic acid synthase SpsE
MTTTFVIAEAASTHDGSLARAHDLIALAAKAGADAVKFQFWADADKLAKRRHVDDFYRAIYHRYRMPVEWLPALRASCAIHGVEFMCTTFLKEDIHLVEPFVKRFKVASFEAGDGQFLSWHNDFDKPVILSTGMMTAAEAAEAVGALEWPQAVLHCVSAYPCASAGLSAIAALQAAVGVPVGFSDHTANVLTGALAVACGAEVVEVHFKAPDTDPDNPDCAPAVPDLAACIANIRYAERMMGDGVKGPTAEEAEMMKYKVA